MSSMRNCPHCNHELDATAAARGECPACRRQFTVRDMNFAGTVEFQEPVLPDEQTAPPAEDVPPVADNTPPAVPPKKEIAATVDNVDPSTVADSALFPHLPKPAPPPAGKKTVPIDRTIEFDSVSSAEVPQPHKNLTVADERNIGMTVQGDKWHPSAKEIEEEGSIEQTFDQAHNSGITPANLRDMTIMWGGSIQPQSVSDSHAQSGSHSPTIDSAEGSVQPGSSRGSSQHGSSFGSSLNIGSSLEESLVIQPRILRPEVDDAQTITQRIDYNLLNKLGEGGMGIVYTARQASIRRTVALKMLKKDGAKKNSQREKFLAEAVVTGELEHPNIVPIYDLGRDEAGAIFYAMKHVKGTPWDACIDQKSLTENLEILMKVADGVAFAHSRRVVHRDLKPENIMLGDFGEVLVMDWGLALALDNLPPNFSMGGTPAYMSPEMAMGPIQAITELSDVYLLGAILFEIITQQRPHVGSTLTKCLIGAARNEIVKTDKSGELLEIAYKAMATNPAERYPSVSALQTAIRTYQSHTESIALAARAAEDLQEARQDHKYDTYARALFGYQEAANLWDGNERAKTGAIEAAAAYAQAAFDKGDFDLGLSLLDVRQPQHQPLIQQLRAAALERDSRQARLRAARRIGAGLVATILFIVTGAFFWIRAEARKARIAEAAAKQSEQQAREAEVVAKQERSEAVRQKGVAESERARAVAALDEAKRQKMLADQQREIAEAKRIEADQQREIAEAKRIEADQQRSVADQQRAAAILAQRKEEQQRKLADAAREKEEYESYVAKLGLASAKIEDNAFDHAAALLESCPPERRNWEWGRLSYLCNQQTSQFDCGFPLEAVATSADGKRVAAGGWGGKIEVIDPATTKRICEIDTGAEYVFAVAFSPDGKTLAAGTNAKPEYISFWNPETGERIGGLKGHTDAVLSLTYSRDGKKLLSSSYDQTARLTTLATGKSVSFVGHDWWVWSANFSPDENRIVTASQDGSVLVWSVDTQRPSPPFLGHTGPVYAAMFAPDGKAIASASYDQRILLWNPADLKEQNLAEALLSNTTNVPTPFMQLEVHTAPVRSVQFSPDGSMLLSASQDNTLGVWDVSNLHLIKRLRGHGSPVSAARFLPEDDSSERVVSVSYDHQARLWNISKYEEMRVLGGRVLKGHRDAVLGAAFSPDGNTVVTASRDRSAIAWDVATGKQLKEFREGHAFLASTAIFLPDGKRVLTAAVDNTARIWDMTSGTQAAALTGTGPHAAIAVAAKGWMVSGSDQEGLKFWDADGKFLHSNPDFKSEITALAVSPDDKTVFVADAVGRCRLLQTANGKTLWENTIHSRSVTAVRFLPDGSRALTSSLDHSVAQWDLATGKEDRARVLKHPDAVTALAVVPTSRQALTACADKIVRLWDLDRAQVLFSFPASTAGTTDLACSPDGKQAFFITADNNLHLWNLETQTEVHAPDGPDKPFLDLSATTLLLWSGSFSEDGLQLLTVGGSEAHLWDAKTAKLLMTFSPQSAVASVQFSEDGKRIVTGSWDNAARVWNSTTGAGLVKLSGVHTRFINTSVFSPDGTQILTASDDGTARLWSSTTGKIEKTFSGHTGRVTDVAFSTDGKRAVTASDDGTARIWDVATAKTLHVLQGHSQAVLCARFSADDQQIVTGSEDTTARLWDADTGAALPGILQGHTASVTSVAFLPDRSRVITGSKDFTAKIWDPATAKEILTLTGHTQEITSVAVSRDGQRILTGSRDGTAIVWLTSPWKEAETNPPTDPPTDKPQDETTQPPADASPAASPPTETKSEPKQ